MTNNEIYQYIVKEIDKYNLQDIDKELIISALLHHLGWDSIDYIDYCRKKNYLIRRIKNEKLYCK